MESTISTKGRVTLPKAVREYLGLKPGDRVKFFVRPDGDVALLPNLPEADLRRFIESLRSLKRTLKD